MLTSFEYYLKYDKGDDRSRKRIGQPITRSALKRRRIVKNDGTIVDPNKFENEIILDEKNLKEEIINIEDEKKYERGNHQYRG